MSKNPLFTSRRFWLMLVDVVVSILLHYFGGPDMNFLIVTIQPVVLAVIIAYTVDNATASKQQTPPG